MLTFKHADIETPGGHASGNVYPTGQSFPTVMPQEEVTDVLHIDLLNSEGSMSFLTESGLSDAGLL